MPDTDIEALIASGPGPAAAPLQEISYLGVPSGYQAKTTTTRRLGYGDDPGGETQTMTRMQAPRYTETDILGPGSLSPERIAQLQAQLARAGLYGSKKAIYRLGIWDDATQNAYAKVLSYANQSGLDVNGAVDSLIAHPMPTDPADKEPVEPGKISKLTDAPTLEAQVQAAAEKRLGRRLRSSELTKFVSLYQGLERKDNTTYAKAQDAAVEGKDTEITSTVPSADVAAEDFVVDNNGQEAASQDAYGYFDALKGLLGG